MAIVIPSKHIFSKSFDPVIDNKIDKIEVNANKVSIQIDKDNLSYTETIITKINQGEIEGQTTYETSAKNFDTDSAIIVVGSHSESREFELLLYSEMKLGFLSIPIKIYDTSYQEKLITDLYDGKDENEKDRIEYTSRYLSQEYSANGEWTYVGIKQPKTTDTVTFATTIVQRPSTYKDGKIINDNLTSATQNQVSFDGNNIKYHFEMNQSFKPQNALSTSNVNLSVSTNLSLADKTNVSTARFTEGTDENGKYFGITLNVLVFRKITTLINSDYQNGYVTVGSKPNSRMMTGSQYRDIATRVVFTFHGETRFLNITELIKYIGNENSKRVFSFDRNELIQTTNTPSIESKYQGIIDKWKNGKQTAVITCPITDYYDTIGNKVISSSKTLYVKLISRSGNVLHFEEVGTRQMKLGSVRIYGTDGRCSYQINVTQFLGRAFNATLQGSEFPRLKEGSTYSLHADWLQISMIFHEGDIVIPYVYTNKGDKPLSYNRDFTPKQFKVVGTKITKKQGGMQELTLQEV